MGAAPDHPGRPGHLLGGGVGAELQRPGVQAEQRDPVGQHVVHLPGDPGAFQLPGLGHPQLLLGLGPFGPLAQRQHQLPAGPHEHAPGQHQQGDHHPPARWRPSTSMSGLGPQQGEEHVGDQAGRGDRHGHRRAPVHHDREVDDQRRDRGGDGEHRQRQRRQRQPERPATAHPERRRAAQAEPRVRSHHPGVRQPLGEQRIRRGRVGRGPQHPADGDEEAEAVDQPVPGRPARVAAGRAERARQQARMLDDDSAGHSRNGRQPSEAGPATKVETWTSTLVYRRTTLGRCGQPGGSGSLAA